MSIITKPSYKKRKNLAIVGAGDAGRLVTSQILDDPDLNYNLLSLIDDDIDKIGQSFKGIIIKGPIKKIKKIVKELDIEEIIIAIPSVSGELIKDIVHKCEESNVILRILPTSFNKIEWLEKGIAGFEQIRPVNIDDFFRKKPVIPDLEKVKNFFQDKVILITGAAGSIGSELVRQLVKFKPEKIIALDIAETPLHNLIINLNHNQNIVIQKIADIRDRGRLEEIFKSFNPSIIFHAAAYKHVPMMEINPAEGVKNNIFGTKNVIDISEKNQVKNFILISTDKAVNPTSVMGMTKRITEMMVQARDSKTKYSVVRFGNVLKSQGSALPLFEEQINKGGPVTITHPDIKRYFMTISEAVQLIIQSPLLGNEKDLFVLKMGESIKITEIVEEMIKLKGLEPHKDIKIDYIGLRTGEKLNEELYTDKEILEKTINERILRINQDDFDKEIYSRNIKNLEKLVSEKDDARIIAKLQETIDSKLDIHKILFHVPDIGVEEYEEVKATLDSGWLTMGTKTIEFEKALSDYIGVKHIIAVNSCTAALHLSLIVAGVNSGDEVITTPFTFTATANVICNLGAKPVFVDIDPRTFNIDIEKIERAITDKTKAIIIVHYGGQSVDMDRVRSIADKYNIEVVEDAAHAIGSHYKGKKIGSLGNLTCFSFYATKNITTGDGGAIATNNDVFASKLRELRLHGISKDAWNRYSDKGTWYYEVNDKGWKYNLTDLQSSIGLCQIKKLDGFIKSKKDISDYYTSKLSAIEGIRVLEFENFSQSSYHFYPIILEDYPRDKFIEEMKDKGIGLSVHFIPLHLQPFYKNQFGYIGGEFPNAEDTYKKIVSLPIYPSLTKYEINYITNSIRKILDKKEILIRNVQPNDSLDILNWRNHSNARRASRNKSEITYESHREWFDKVIKDPNIKIFVFSDRDQKIGQVRFNKNGDNAEVSITVNPEFYGKGYGYLILKTAIAKYFNNGNIIALVAEIQTDNISSIKIFKKAGFKEVNNKGTWKVYHLLKEEYFESACI
jgi:FlaA1/EpsC-like NDP-sugar epimerase/RimJ/RimL family protein N-acetyltransferase